MADDSDRWVRETFRLPKSDADGLEDLVETNEFANKSEALRCAVTRLLDDYPPEVEEVA